MPNPSEQGGALDPIARLSDPLDARFSVLEQPLASLTRLGAPLARLPRLEDPLAALGRLEDPMAAIDAPVAALGAPMGQLTVAIRKTAR
jgi:hypothetical protein